VKHAVQGSAPREPPSFSWHVATEPWSRWLSPLLRHRPAAAWRRSILKTARPPFRPRARPRPRRANRWRSAINSRSRTRRACEDAKRTACRRRVVVSNGRAVPGLNTFKPMPRPAGRATVFDEMSQVASEPIQFPPRPVCRQFATPSGSSFKPGESLAHAELVPRKKCTGSTRRQSAPRAANRSLGAVRLRYPACRPNQACRTCHIYVRYVTVVAP